VEITTAITWSPTPLTPIIPSKQQSYATCMTKSFYDVPGTTKITILSTTFTSYQWLMPCQPVRELSTTFQRSHDVSGRSDTQ
jgi:hypothetical protein